MIPLTLTQSPWSKPVQRELYTVQEMDMRKKLISPEQLPILIGNLGHAYRGSWYKGNENVSANFLFSSMFSLDFDTGLSPDTLLEVCNDTEFGKPYFIYTTQNHKPEHPRFRAVWTIEINLNAKYDEYKKRIKQLAEPFVDDVDKRILSHYSRFQGSFNGLYFVDYSQLNRKITV